MSLPQNSVVVLAGGVGAAKFLQGLALVHEAKDTTVIVNTGDDTVFHGLNISPDIDTIIYTLANVNDVQKGWGLADETWRSMESLKRFVKVRPPLSHAAPDWFNLGDQDLATHFYRTARLAEGASPTSVTTELARAWNLAQTIMPMSDDQVATIVELAKDCPAGQKGDEVNFQEYFVKFRHSLEIRAVRFRGAQSATPSFLDALHAAKKIIIAPSNPIVSIGPIRALPGVDQLLLELRHKVVAISPIIGGRALKGPADRMLVELGHDSSALGVARLYAPIVGTIIVDRVDAILKEEIEALGVKCVITDTIMKSQVEAADLAHVVLQTTANS